MKPWARVRVHTRDLNLGRVANYLRCVRYRPFVNTSVCAARFQQMARSREIAHAIAASSLHGHADPGGHLQQVR